MNFKFIITTGLLVFAHQCWAATESLLDLRFEDAGTNAEVKTAIQPTNCAVVINTPNDLRLNKETLGTTFRDNPIISKPAMATWLQEALFGMKKLGLNPMLATEASGHDVTYVSTDLRKVYIWNHGMNLHATLVVKARIQNGSKPEVQHNYRVISTKLNWANGDGEFITTLNMAATRFLEQLAADINKECQGTTEL